MRGRGEGFQLENVLLVTNDTRCNQDRVIHSVVGPNAVGEVVRFGKWNGGKR